MRNREGWRGCLYALLYDIYRGAVLGDFASVKGPLGYVTQALLGYVPVVGTISAVRDALCDWQEEDRVGVALNVLAALPLYGGLLKTVEVIRSARRVHGALFRPRRRRRGRGSRRGRGAYAATP